MDEVEPLTSSTPVGLSDLVLGKPILHLECGVAKDQVLRTGALAQPVWTTMPSQENQPSCTGWQTAFWLNRISVMQLRGITR